MIRHLFRTALVLAGAASVAPAQLPTGAQLLVDARWLKQHLNDRDLVILTVGRESGYAKGHIPGSRSIWVGDLSTPMPWPRPPGDSSLELEMPPTAQLLAAFEARGISNNSRIVVVADSGWDSPAARVLFTLGYVGLGDRAVLLDGGVTAWHQAGFPVTTIRSTVAPGHLTLSLVPSMIVDARYLMAREHASGVKLIDARAPAYFTRPNTDQSAGGHIPGAANIPFSSLLEDDTDLYLPKAELQQRFLAAGVQPGDTVVAYCHVGQQATVVLFAARLLGHPTKLYDGSFEDWSNRKLPTEVAH